MKIKLAYPKIPDTLDCPLKKCIAFEKLDGTNIHWVWNKDLGWYAFGTRRDRFDLDEQGIRSFNQAHPGLEDAVALFNKSYAHLGQYPIPHKYAPLSKSGDVTLFTEYLGDKSFAGSHQKDDPKRLVLFDVAIDDEIVPPFQFLIDYGQFEDLPDNQAGSKIEGYHLPKVVFDGTFSGQLFVDVRKNKFKLNEGVVVKGMFSGKVYMAKIKTEAYLERLKNEFKNEWKNYWE
jgi:hypothetical protein